jgi:hypothetical protein
LKRIATIFLLVTYLYDLGGYLGLRQYLVYRTDRILNEQNKKGVYNIDDLTEVKIPYHSPEVKDWSGFASISGQVQFPNTCYNYVKMRKTRDTLYLLCVPIYESTHLVPGNIVWALHVKDIPVPKKDHIPNVGMFMLGFKPVYSLIRLQPPFIRLRSYSDYLSPLIDRHIEIPKQPPKQLC